MKKYFILLLCLLLATFYVVAEGNAQARKELEAESQAKPKYPLRFKTGVQASVTAANNVFDIRDIFQDELVIDFTKIAASLPKEGIELAAASNIQAFINLTFFEDHAIRLFVNASLLQYANIPKSLVDLIAVGNANTPTISGSNMTVINSFAEIGAMYSGTFGKLGVKVKPAYFATLAYVQGSSFSYNIVSDENNGSFMINSSARLTAYSPFATKEPFSIGSILKGGGFDIGLGANYNFFSWMNIGLWLENIPIYPATATQVMRLSFDAEVGYANFALKNNTSNKTEYLSGSQKIYRPFKTELFADFRPFSNNYLIISPYIGFVFSKPFRMTGGLTIESKFLKVLGAYFTVAREDFIWKNELGLYLDSNWFTFKIGAGLASTQFKQIFTKLSGATVKFELSFGF